jgi:hypothetical protein
LLAAAPRQVQLGCHGCEGRDRVFVAAGTAGPNPRNLSTGCFGLFPNSRLTLVAFSETVQRDL